MILPVVAEIHLLESDDTTFDRRLHILQRDALKQRMQTNVRTREIEKKHS